MARSDLATRCRGAGEPQPAGSPCCSTIACTERSHTRGIAARGLLKSKEKTHRAGSGGTFPPESAPFSHIPAGPVTLPALPAPLWQKPPSLTPLRCHRGSARFPRGACRQPALLQGRPSPLGFNGSHAEGRACLSPTGSPGTSLVPSQHRENWVLLLLLHETAFPSDSTEPPAPVRAQAPAPCTG